MEENLVCVFSTGQEYLAALVRQMLSDNGIDAFILNKRDSFYQIGDIELYVNQDAVIRSKRLIREFEKK